jgi:hypothetical protein
MSNKILFAKRIKIHNTDNTYLAPFVYDSKGKDYLHEPNINLSTADIVFKGDIIQNMKKALAGHNMEYISADFRANVVKFKMENV